MTSALCSYNSFNSSGKCVYEIHNTQVFYRVEVRTLCRPVKFFHTKPTHPSLYGPCFVHLNSFIWMGQQILLAT
ncbi:hypothetical protein EXN66_Car000151 [Channa argus]|uniref:Uncharacterized protein n=1 Tax=Channa argus TaxID=215402 RepID=A0A6G1QXC9_CHAAH|nr:hypothetical protein EXN66_Car000151 [Channa argus]